ncbi:MAG: WG repeat-containing protein, partial [Muribaculaceae bacterium]|nr:WG repeat-containing protein [Muribaculaceae bacterium]
GIREVERSRGRGDVDKRQDIEGKKTYRIILKDDETYTTSNTSAYITANRDNHIVLVDGIPMGETPVLIESIESGEHTISVPNMYGYTMRDTIVQITEGNKNQISLTLHQQKPESVEVDWVRFGGDTAGQYVRWGYNIFETNGKKGVKNYVDEIVVPCEFDKVYLEKLYPGYFVVGITEMNGDNSNKLKEGIYDANSKRLVVPTKYDSVSVYDLKDGSCFVKICSNVIDGHGWRGRKEGVYDVNKDCEIIPPIYDGICPLGYGQFLFKRGDTLGVVNSQGIESFPSILLYFLSDYEPTWCTFDATNGIIPMKNKLTGKIGYMNRNYKLVIPDIYDEAFAFTPDVHGWSASVWLNDENFSIDLDGNRIIKDLDGNRINNLKELPEVPGGFYITDWDDNIYKVAEVSNDNEYGQLKLRYGYINQSGDILANIIYGYDDAMVWDENGELTYEAMINDERTFSEGLAILNIGDRYGFIDYTGKVVVPLIYTAVTPFDDGIAFLRDQEGKWHKVYRKDLK